MTRAIDVHNPAVEVPAAAPDIGRERPPAGRGPALSRGRGLLGVVLVTLVLLGGFAAPLLARYGPNEQLSGANLLGMGAGHWLGTDDLNRDVLSRVLYGIRTSILVIVAAVPVGALVGSLVGLVSSLSSGLDTLTQRVFDVLLAFPVLILGITFAAVIGPGIGTVVLVIAVSEIPIFGRVLRGAVLRVREMPYVEAAAVVGGGRWWILRRHVLPNSVEPVGVQLAVSTSLAVFVEGAMSFIGIGVRPPDPSLGSLIAGSIPNLDINPAMAVGPLAVVVALVLGFLLIAQSLGERRRELT